MPLPEDLDAFLNTDEFGETLTFSASGAVVGIWDQRAEDEEGELGIVGGRPMFTCKASDAPANAETATRNGTVFEVVNRLFEDENDSNQGFVRLVLKENPA